MAFTGSRPWSDTARKWLARAAMLGAVHRVRRTLAERAARRGDLRDMHERLEAILEHAPLGIAFARSSRFELVSRHLAQMFGRDIAELQGQSTRMMYASDADRSDLVSRAKAMFATNGCFDGEARLVRANGSVFWGRLRARAVHHGDVSAGTIWIVEDVTHEREQHRQLSWAADHDALTGLANRASFDRQLARAVDEDQPFSALFMDLDHFKQVNDSAGHAAGDRVLREVAAMIAGTLRQSDLVARLGGDEFGALLLDCPAERALAVGEAIRRAVDGYRLPWNNVSFGVGISIGVVHRDEAFDTVEQVMHAADTACYAAKRGGRNRVVMYSPVLHAAQAA
ncbi:MAG: sensor domain-containing diguanylate cyclase [Burkholderiaceae bacterium]